MNKYFILVTLISAFFHAENDFDWRGISAGMTKEQVENIRAVVVASAVIWMKLMHF